MKRLCLLIVFTTLIFTTEIFACQCARNPPFLTAIKNESTKVIAKVKIRRYLTYFDHPHGNTYVTSMEVEIEELYQGKEERKKITIWGTEGSNCLEYLSEFEINKSFVVAIFERGNSEYNLSNCGQYWLAVEEGFVKGRITEEKGSMSVDELKSEIHKKQAINSAFFIQLHDNLVIYNFDTFL